LLYEDIEIPWALGVNPQFVLNGNYLLAHLSSKGYNEK
jgi:hypothetical protein